MKIYANFAVGDVVRAGQPAGSSIVRPGIVRSESNERHGAHLGEKSTGLHRASHRPNLGCRACRTADSPDKTNALRFVQRISASQFRSRLTVQDECVDRQPLSTDNGPTLFIGEGPRRRPGSNTAAPCPTCRRKNSQREKTAGAIAAASAAQHALLWERKRPKHGSRSS